MSHLSFKNFLKREKFTLIFGLFIFFYILGTYLIFEFDRDKSIYIAFLYLFLFFIYIIKFFLGDKWFYFVLNCILFQICFINFYFNLFHLLNCTL